MGIPMDLNFQLFETATLFITVIVVAFMLQVCDNNLDSSAMFSVTMYGCVCVCVCML